MKARTFFHIVCGLIISGVILVGLFRDQTYGAKPTPNPTATPALAPSSACAGPTPGTAPVNPPAGGFGIDGDLQANYPTADIGDWLPTPTGFSGSGGFVINNNGTSVNGTTTFHLTDVFGSNGDNNFTGGRKVDQNPNTDWAWTFNPVNNKQDINNALVHITTSTATDPISGQPVEHTWVIVSADRFSNNGNAYVDFEFLQKSLTANADGTFTSAGIDCGRTVNDFILTVSFTNGGTVPGVCFSRWLPSSKGCHFDYFDQTPSLPAGAVFAAVNGSPVDVPYGAFGNFQYPENTFVEAAIDLTALLAALPDPCVGIGIDTLFVKTKESQSSSATITDFITPIKFPLELGLMANAGDDQEKCSEGSSTAFTITGTATAGIHSITSMTWSVVGGSATIDQPVSCQNCTSLGPTVVHVTTAPATIRLTVVDSSGCTKTDDVVLKVNNALTCSISGANSMCPSSSGMYSGPAGADSYAWSISGNATFAGGGTTATTKDVTVNTTSDCGTFTLSLEVTKSSCKSMCQKDVSVADTMAPVISALPATSTIACPATPVFTTPTAADDCLGTVTLTFEDVTTNLDCTQPGHLKQRVTRTWTATDSCGNSSQKSQIINIADTTAPTISPLPGPSTIECPATPVFTTPMASDACDESPTLTHSDVTTPGSCPGAYSITRTWTATDACGNHSSASQTINVHCDCGVCTTTSSITSNFNGTSINPSNYIWFNANFKASGIQEGTTIFLTGSTIDISVGGNSYPVTVPNATITFSAQYSCATTTFMGGQWVTHVPLSGSDEIFLSGLLVQAGSITNADLKGATVTWTGDFSTNTSGVNLSWKWGAAVYQANTTVANAAANPNLIGVKPTHTNACNINGSDHAGTPMNLKKSVIGGARGGGGSNFTGSWSGTQNVAPCVNPPVGSASMSASSLQSSSAATSSTSALSTASNICPAAGSLRTLTMTYEGRNAGGGTVTGNPGGLDAAYIVVTGGSSSNLFSGAVSFDSRTDPGSAYFVIDGGNAPLPQQVTVAIYTARGGGRVSTVTFDTSCKQPLNIGDYFGSLRVSTGSQ
jgi:hypothetical protein